MHEKYNITSHFTAKKIMFIFSKQILSLLPTLSLIVEFTQKYTKNFYSKKLNEWASNEKPCQSLNSLVLYFAIRFLINDWSNRSSHFCLSSQNVIQHFSLLFPLTTLIYCICPYTRRCCSSWPWQASRERLSLLFCLFCIFDCSFDN